MACLAALGLSLILGGVAVVKADWTVSSAHLGLWAVYGLVVFVFLMSRFALALAYRSPASRETALSIQMPRLAVVVPAFNEGEGIVATCQAIDSLDYDPGLVEIVVVDDGSDDDTLERLDAYALQRGEHGTVAQLTTIRFSSNQGKRAAMAAGIRGTTAEVLVFVDSDSVLDVDALSVMVTSLESDPKVGAVCGHAEVLNPRESWLTRMQAVRYFSAFRVVKAAESVFGAVTCCSGCFSVYRREAVMPHLEWWETQTFLGRPSLFGDDRSLTNCVLREWKVLYESRAVVRTRVPADLRVFLKQQARWKRSWTRESFITARVIWSKPAPAIIATFTGIALTLLAPLVLIRIAWLATFEGRPPWIFLFGMCLMALAYGLVYLAARPRSGWLWMFGTLFVPLYAGVLVWQTYYAAITSRRSGWGTRGASAVVEERPAVSNARRRSRSLVVGSAALLAYVFVVGTAGAVSVPAPPATASASTSPHIRITYITERALRLTVTQRRAQSSSIVGYRIYRNGRVVGQVRCARPSLSVRIVPGVRYRLWVRPVYRNGRLGRQTSPVVARGVVRSPGTPTALAVVAASDTSAEVTWGSAKVGTRPIGAYLVRRDGAVVGRTRSNRFSLRLSTLRTFQISVSAVDSQGMAGRASVLALATGHTAPTVPTDLRVERVEFDRVRLSWAPSTAFSGTLAGYRIYRDGKLVTTVHGPEATISGLASNTTYGFEVAAIDSRSYLSASTPMATVRTPAPPQTAGDLSAFVLTSTDSSFADFREHYLAIGTMYPTYFDCDRKTGAITGEDNNGISSWARARGVRIEARVNCQDGLLLHRMFTEPDLRAATIARIAGLAKDNGYEGINLDFEAGAAADRNLLTAFVRDLAASLHSDGKELSVDVSPKLKDVLNHPRSTFFDYKALVASADHVIVMAWGYHWSTSVPGGTADLPWWTQVLNYVGTMPSKSRFVVCLPAYSRDWPSGGGPEHPGEAISWPEVALRATTAGVLPLLNPVVGELTFQYNDSGGTPHEVWAIDSSVLASRAATASSQGFQVSLWRLGQEDPAVWTSGGVFSERVAASG